MVKVLKSVSDLSRDVPVIIVGTKKDRLDQDAIANEDGPNETSPGTILIQREDMFRQAYETDKRTKPFWSKLNTKFVFVSSRKRPPLSTASARKPQTRRRRRPSNVVAGDSASINALTKLTVDSIDDPRTSEALTAAQVSDMDAKIDQAVDKVLNILRQPAPHKKEKKRRRKSSTMTTSRQLCRDIATGCFGLSEAKAKEIEAVVGRIIWPKFESFLRVNPGTVLRYTGEAVGLAGAVYG
jgi:hypothetical protein